MNSIDILYEDNEIYVINKAAGLSVQGGANISHSLDVDFAKQTGQKVFLVHRLDKDTSGLMIVAKNSVSASKWTKLIAGKEIKKEYLALCAGSLKEKKGIISEDIEQHGQIKRAITNFTVEKEWNEKIEDENSGSSEIHLCLVRLLLDTGRMHQIRIHLAKKGCPIAGDDLHGNFKANKLLKKFLKIKRLQLASVRLSIPLNFISTEDAVKENNSGSAKLSISGKNLIIEIPYPFSVHQLCSE